MFSPPRILIFKFPFVSALFQWIANKNDSHFYNPWECGERAFQKNLFFSRGKKKREKNKEGKEKKKKAAPHNLAEGRI